MKPQVNERPSRKTLEQSILAYIQKQGNEKIYPVGWSASLKISGNWKINFYFQDFQERYVTAEWEYNKETDQLYPFEFHSAPMFWERSKRKVEKLKQ